MIYSVITTNAAKQDILQAARYIAEKLHNPTAADLLLDEVDEAISSLEDMPLRHQLVNDGHLAHKGIRLLTVRNYLALYVVRDDDKNVIVQRFLYAKRNWAGILKGN